MPDTAPLDVPATLEDDEAGLRAELAPVKRRQVSVAVALGIGCIASFTVHDLIWRPEVERGATLVRLTTLLALVATLIGLRRARQTHHIDALVTAAGATGGISAALMCHTTGGIQSAFFPAVGLTLSVVGAFALSPPWLFRRSVVPTLVVYFVPLPWTSTSGTHSPGLIILYVLLSGLVAIFAAKTRWRFALNAWTLRRDLERANEHLKLAAETDALTGLKNRGALERHLNERLRPDQLDAPTSLVLIDLDHFKQVNDQYGHREGDRVLRLVAVALLDALRTGDHAFRYGGDEMVVLLPGAEKAAGLEVAKRVSAALQALFVSPELTLLRLGASMGVIDLRPGSDPSVAAVLERADRLLYRAKDRARGGIVTTLS